MQGTNHSIGQWNDLYYNNGVGWTFNLLSDVYNFLKGVCLKTIFTTRAKTVTGDPLKTTDFNPEWFDWRGKINNSVIHLLRQ